MKSVSDAGTQTDEKSLVLGAKVRYIIIYVKELICLTVSKTILLKIQS